MFFIRFIFCRSSACDQFFSSFICELKQNSEWNYFILRDCVHVFWGLFICLFVFYCCFLYISCCVLTSCLASITKLIRKPPVPPPLSPTPPRPPTPELPTPPPLPPPPTVTNTEIELANSLLKEQEKPSSVYLD